MLKIHMLKNQYQTQCKTVIKKVIFGILLTLSSTSFADDKPSLIADLQTTWAKIKYQMPVSNQEYAFQTLAKRSQAAIEASPQDAAAWVWHGIILSSWAGEKGGLGALKLVKQAKAALEMAIKLDAHVLDGSAYTSLGALYYKVPGWPIAFGDKDKARDYLKQGLSFNPDGIDSNYFYGDFLAQHGDDAQARNVLQHALEAAPRAQRPIADQGRRREIQQRLSTLNAH